MHKNPANWERRLKELEKKKLISKRPHPLFAFVLFLISAILFLVVNRLKISGLLFSISRFAVILSFLFALLHFIIVRILEKKQK